MDSGQQASLTPETFRRIRRIFESALEVPADRRKALLANECAGDVAMIRELELMLAADATNRSSDGAQMPESGVRECPSCKSQLAPADRFCRLCGTPLEAEHVEEGRFRSGALFANRFRIAGMLRRGGMGEVYRATDLELGQPVALKFLLGYRFDERSRNRFRNEVKLARQISHPNVCRVYDIGESQGELYLSMEYIGGEDLGSLLKRIGRLAPDKGLQIARKLCAGLAAAHARGVLHRDLKPGNIMIDVAGEVRITDFGLAAAAEQIFGADARSGTPAYMAPEQLAGREASVQSDLYALGLVLYEIFTGKVPFQATDLEQLLRLKESTPPTSPSSHVPDMETAVERVILRCLEPDPRARPSSALVIAAALPGGNPLAEALAAGETPSPDMVAASGPTEALRPAVAMGLLGGIVLLLAAFCWLTPRVHMMSQLPLDNSRDVLTVRAQDIMHRLGYGDRPVDFASGFQADGPEVPNRGPTDAFRSSSPYFEYMSKYVSGSTPSRMAAWKQLLSQPPLPLSFWYRQSPQPLVSTKAVRLEAPSPVVSGMVSIELGLDGRLLRFSAVPPEFDSSSYKYPPNDWTVLFDAAHLEFSRFQPVEPQWAPLAATDSRFAWAGPYPDRPDLPVRVEAASFRGRVVYFDVVFPWRTTTRTATPVAPAAFWRSTLVLIPQALIALFGALLARHNLRVGRGDLRGAFRLSFVYFMVSFLIDVLQNKSVVTDIEVFVSAVGVNVYFSLLTWAFYIAIEPWVRRYWPQTIITWSRLLAGRWRDPLVARDVLVGLLFGLTVCLVWGPLGTLASTAVDTSPLQFFPIANLNGFGAAVAWFFNWLRNGVLVTQGFLLLLCLLRVMLRKQWLASMAFVGLWELAALIGNERSLVIASVTMLIMSCGMVLLLTRFGLLAPTAAFVGVALFEAFFTTEFGSWYGQSSLFAMIVVSGLALLAFRLSLGDRPLSLLMRT